MWSVSLSDSSQIRWANFFQICQKILPILWKNHCQLLFSPLSYAAERVRSFNSVLHRQQAYINSREGQRTTISLYVFHFIEKHRNNANSLFLDYVLNLYPWIYCQHERTLDTFHSILWVHISYQLSTTSSQNKFPFAELLLTWCSVKKRWFEHYIPNLSSHYRHQHYINQLQQLNLKY